MNTPVATDRASDYERIGAALRFLEQNRNRPTSLREVAEDVGLSEYHFQRLFTRWTGISPKRFAQYLTLDDARQLLRAPRSLLDVSHAVGLSGTSRLYDLFATIDAVTPGEFKSGGAGLRIDYGSHASPFGECLIGVTDRGVCWLSFSDAVEQRDDFGELRATWPAAELRENRRATAPPAKRIFTTRSGGGPRRLRLLVGGTNFQLKVWEALLRIPAGRVMTYADVAAAIGHPTSARAVGNAVAANRISYLIPCHRVIRNMGVVSNYRWGPIRKRALLAWEAARYAEPHTRRSV